MPTFKVHLAYTKSDEFISETYTASCKTVEDARKMCVAAYKPIIVTIKKIKLVREHA